MEGSGLPGFIEIYLEGLRKTTKIEDSRRPGRRIIERDIFRIQAKSVMASEDLKMCSDIVLSYL
jgi:hypothetical protein